jgi:outer membrane protein assembly factor BamB
MRIRTFPVPAAVVILAVASALRLAKSARAADQPQWGQASSRNMVSAEKGLPDSFDPVSKKNVRWVAELGTQSYASAVVARGRVLIGTNNDHPRDPKHDGDRAVLLCLDEADGHLVWQFVVPKLSEDENDRFLDWPKVGFASPPTVEGDRVYTLSNRGEVVCLDLNGMANGNDGPYKDEAKHAAPRGHAPVEPGPTDADVIWICDLVKEAGIHTHDQVHGSILVRGDLLYVNSCNGVDETHRKIRKPDAPSLVVLDKHTGRLVARDGVGIGADTFHCEWSSPSFGEVAGRPLIFFGGDNGVCYAFDALAAVPPDGPPVALKEVWHFDTDPAAPKQDVHKWVSNRKESPSVIMGMPVFDGGRIYVASGGDLWWGKRQGWLKCIDATKTGDVTKTAEVWSYPLSRETSCTPAVSNGLVFAVDCGGMIHCVDAATGKPYWTHKAVGDFWASTLVADGKLFVGTRRGQFLVMAAGKEEKVLATVELKEAISGTATAANGTLYVPTAGHLYAIRSERPEQARR